MASPVASARITAEVLSKDGPGIRAVQGDTTCAHPKCIEFLMIKKYIEKKARYAFLFIFFYISILIPTPVIVQLSATRPYLDESTRGQSNITTFNLSLQATPASSCPSTHGGGGYYGLSTVFTSDPYKTHTHSSVLHAPHPTHPAMQQMHQMQQMQRPTSCATSSLHPHSHHHSGGSSNANNSPAPSDVQQQVSYGWMDRGSWID